jgi:multidrug efflux pump subunit AcrA (membrane-fusion protein)
VYVVNDKDMVEERPVTFGSRQDDFVAINEGLKPEDRVIVSHQKQVREAMIVKPVTAPAVTAPKERREKP